MSNAKLTKYWFDSRGGKRWGVAQLLFGFKEIYALFCSLVILH